MLDSYFNMLDSYFKLLANVTVYVKVKLNVRIMSRRQLRLLLTLIDYSKVSIHGRIWTQLKKSSLKIY